LVYNGVNKNIFKYKEHTKFNNKILYIGRLREDKGLIYLINATRELKNISLSIVGKGNLSLIENNVSYLGFKTHNEIKEILDTHDILILPTTSDSSESFPNVILEGLSSGIIVIGSDVAGIKEMLPECCLIKEKDSDSILKKIIDIKCRPKYYRKILKSNSIKLNTQQEQIKKIAEVLFNEKIFNNTNQK
jgi:glycosyltransferase involved in cell wall biosynthesis